MSTSYRSESIVWLPGMVFAVVLLLLVPGWTAAQKPHSVAQLQAGADTVSLNEFMPDPASDWNGNGTIADADDEYIELFNPTGDMIDLGAWQLDDAEGGSAPYVLPATSQVAAGGFLLLFGSETGIALNNSGDTVRLLRPDGSVAEVFSYASTRPDEAYSKQVDGGGEWTRDYPPSPGLSNQPSPQPTATDTQTPTPGPTATPFPLGVVLNEFMPDPASDWNGNGSPDQGDEYIELFNTADEPVNVGGWLLDDEDDGDTSSPDQNPEGSRPYRIPDGVVLPARGYLLFFRQETGVTLNNDGDWVRLLHPDGQVVEAFTYTGSRDDEPYSKTTDGGLSWTRDYPPSPGVSNTAAITVTATASPTATVVPTTPTPYPEGVGLNEFLPRPAYDWNGDGDIDADDEYVELFSANQTVVDLSGWVLDDVDDGQQISPEGSRPYRLPDGTVISGLGYLVLFRNQTGVGLNDDGDVVRLLRPDGSEVEQHSYAGADPDVAYSKLVDGGSNWTSEYPPSPGHPNGPGYSPTDEVRLNEFLASPRDVDWDGDGSANYLDEWVEIHNAGQATVDLAGWKLTDDAPSAMGPDLAPAGTYLFPASTLLAPGEFRLVFRSQSGLALNASDEWIRLLHPDDTEADVVYADRFSGYDQAWCRLPDGSGSWTLKCQETPGEANQPAPGTGSRPGASQGPAEPPYDRFNHHLVTVSQARSLPDDTLVTIQGRITALPGIFDSRQAYIQDATGGILVYLRSAEWPPLSAGQWVRVNGPLDTFYGEREVRLTRIDDVKTLAPDIPAPVVDIPTGDVAELNEGRLVRISGSAVGFRGNTLFLDDGSGRAAVLVLASTGTRRPYVTLGDTWTMVGIVSQRDDEPPFTDGYRLLPRGEVDLGQGSPAQEDPSQGAWSAAPLLLPVTGAAGSPYEALSRHLGLLATCASLGAGLLMSQWKRE